MITDQSHAVFYTLSLHDALPISRTSASYGYHRRFHKQVTACSDDGSNNHVGYAASGHQYRGRVRIVAASGNCRDWRAVILDRKSTRLNSSHVAISYAVFCMKKKN